MFWTLHLTGCLSLNCLFLFLEFWSILSFALYFFVSVYLLRCKGQSLSYSPGWGNSFSSCVYAGEAREGIMLLAWLLASFQSLPLLPTNKLGPSGAYSWVGGFLYILGPCGSLQQSLLWGWEFFLPLQPHRFFQRFSGFLFPLWNRVAQSVSLLGWSSWFILMPMWHSQPPPHLFRTLATDLPCILSALVAHLCPGCPSLPLLLAWMNIL